MKAGDGLFSSWNGPDNATHPYINNEYGWLWVNRISGYYQSETQNSVNKDSVFFGAKMGSFSLWDFNSNLMINNWTVGLFVKNMFNEEGIVGIYKEEYMGTSPEQKYYGNGGKNIIARPRTVGVSATWNF